MLVLAGARCVAVKCSAFAIKRLLCACSSSAQAAARLVATVHPPVIWRMLTVLSIPSRSTTHKQTYGYCMTVWVLFRLQAASQSK